jgi:hypothetical protein
MISLNPECSALWYTDVVLLVELAMAYVVEEVVRNVRGDSWSLHFTAGSLLHPALRGRRAGDERRS